MLNSSVSFAMHMSMENSNASHTPGVSKTTSSPRPVNDQ